MRRGENILKLNPERGKRAGNSGMGLVRGLGGARQKELLHEEGERGEETRMETGIKHSHCCA